MCDVRIEGVRGSNPLSSTAGQRPVPTPGTGLLHCLVSVLGADLGVESERLAVRRKKPGPLCRLAVLDIARRFGHPRLSSLCADEQGDVGHRPRWRPGRLGGVAGRTPSSPGRARPWGDEETVLVQIGARQGGSGQEGVSSINVCGRCSLGSRTASGRGVDWRASWSW